MITRFRQFVLLLLLAHAASCSVTCADQQPAFEGVMYFEQHVRPLLVTHCYSCHSEKEAKREGGLLLDSRMGWSVGGDNGPAVIAGDVDGSLLIQSVRYNNTDLQMPPTKPLSSAEIAVLEQWVRIGAPDPRDGAVVERVESHQPSDPVAGRQHWAFQPLHSPKPPACSHEGWATSPIDHFVMAGLEANQLGPAEDADRATLLRRVCFQLTGLPPAPDQMKAFLTDDSDGAFERVIDELLQSPRFGERWGRHWLDLARYADSNGLDENFLFREAWRYRNWVIDAVNADMPFDQFLKQQIAGDLLPYDSTEQRDRQRIAAGFLVIGPKVLLGNDPNERIMDVADEQLTTIGRAVLGQTLGCARCHDHKFDPIPTADYYALAGIFTSTRVLEQRYMLGQQRVMEQLIGLGDQGHQLDGDYEEYWRDLSQLKEKQTQAKKALELLKTGDAVALAEHAAKHKDALGEGVADVSRALQERIDAQEAFVAGIDHSISNPPPIPPRAMVPTDVDAPADEYIRLAGRFDQKVAQVNRGFLQVLSSQPNELPKMQSGRLELADWLTDVDDGAGRLAARVLANRIWHHLIGRGIVRTVDNFGRTGETPSHPELLDHLASAVIESNWSIKAVIRQIVLSRTFAMSSRHNEAAFAIDPENRWLWRANRRRLDPESLRDAMLMAAGTLDLKPMDSSVWYLGDQATAVGANTNRRRTDFPCRSVYLPVIRNDLPEIFDVFNFANPHAGTGMRPGTMSAMQGLFLLNDESVMTAAEATAARVINQTENPGSERVALAMFELLFSQAGTDAERNAVVSYLVQMTKQLHDSGDPEAELHAWSMVCHALFASSRFQLLE